PASGKVMAEFHVNPDIPVTEGSYAMVGGFDALGVTRLELVLGEPDAPRIPEGGMVDTRPTTDMLAEFGNRAPGLMDGADEVLTELNAVLKETNRMLSTPESDFRRTLASAQGSVAQIESLLASERDRIASILAGMDSVTSDIDTALGPDGENVSDLMARLNQTLDTLDRDLAAFSETNTQLSTLLRKLNDGEGTLGRLINDASMYERMDSTLTGLNNLITDFQENPARYLKEMKLVDLF
ncbi:MAG: hypothetical protein O3C45_07650, partial [Bacteroidetes bacterium]|nr:hypothetical protein [Bacteroidota bacterium]